MSDRKQDYVRCFFFEATCHMGKILSDFSFGFWRSVTKQYFTSWNIGFLDKNKLAPLYTLQYLNKPNFFVGDLKTEHSHQKFDIFGSAHSESFFLKCLFCKKWSMVSHLFFVLFLFFQTNLFFFIKNFMILQNQAR